MSREEFYVDREQTFVKHVILERYLERFAHIIGFNWDTITYVDAFAGPWNVKSDKLQDSSFYIAANELRKAKARAERTARNLISVVTFLKQIPLLTGP